MNQRTNACSLRTWTPGKHLLTGRHMTTHITEEQKKKPLAERIEIRQVAVLSTAHCPNRDVADGNLFAGHPQEQWRLYHKSEYGSGYYFGSDKDIINQELRPIVGNALADVFITLAEAGFVEVRFDSDAEIIEDFMVFNWYETKAA